MARKSKPLTCTFFIGDKQVDKLPPEYLDKMAERLSLVMSRYYTAHPDEYAKLVNADIEKERNSNKVQQDAKETKIEARRGAMATDCQSVCHCDAGGCDCSDLGLDCNVCIQQHC